MDQVGSKIKYLYKQLTEKDGEIQYTYKYGLHTVNIGEYYDESVYSKWIAYNFLMYKLDYLLSK